MNRWLTAICLKAYVLLTAGRPRLPIGVASLPFRQIDRDNWCRFMLSESGSRVIARMRAFEAKQAVEGAKDVFHTAHSAGRTQGYGMAVDHLISLATCQPDEPRPEVVETKDQEQTELEELVERYSP